MFDMVFHLSPGYKTDTRPTTDGKRGYVHILPTVDECKKALARTMKEPEWYTDS